MRKTGAEGGLVYSTEHGKMCPGCSKPVAECVCRQHTLPTGGDGTVRVRLETKGRKGKGVTVITGVPLGLDALTELGKQLRRKCGSGGTVKEGVLEIQGDHCDMLLEELKKQSWTVKKG